MRAVIRRDRRAMAWSQMNATRRRPVRNGCLAALPTGPFHRWHPRLEYVELRLTEVFYEPGDPLTYVYFPTVTIVGCKLLG